jgi:APA family basic amino acid/polyamine antiporter
MAAVLVMLIPVAQMPGGASFAEAFQHAGMGWAKYVVALGACTGIASSLLVRLGLEVIPHNFFC